MGESTTKAAAAKLFGTAPKKPAAKPAADPAPKQSAPRRKKGGAKKATAKQAPPNRGNSLGRGFYLYKGGVAKKLSAYLEPGVALGLKTAAAGGADPRGADMSEIVNTLLKEAGYEAKLPPGYLDGLPKG
ncbi:hypothetical protein RQM47_15970 [Rubrivirga sp. S365]|uniref:hypothetical protein n=1 Tax=Rubrivirga sp. S365 TaxID=3076080 RepID=UPI0028CA2F32|nr:hypothetical protein [Rubrivirga sp. S365]MDT7858145.1 hypothetical protein [Rubrivirga sp. S365]